ncbi:hypothetical protein [Microbulbifer agarilyticus]|uniref:hypothetical protein n=1 Tax=Microbulbifer agarilyticus TaxID=260552 RepID=UPI001CD668C1|nr:hypothetical protein [Microbulbifer agarilyticus]MCA0893574.1 hypothetical protein [Microbulbifer agarilyticus]
MRRILLTALISFGLLACGKPTVNDFEVVCGIFESISRQQDSLTEETMLRVSMKKIREQLVEGSPARDSWEAITGAPMSERYNLFKEGADATLKRNWECPAMKAVIEASAHPSLTENRSS